jgi:hypothetical protein
MTNEEIAIQQHLSKPRPYSMPCGCLGSQGDDPKCPCAMEWCEQVSGIWYVISENRCSTGIDLTATALK